MKPSEKSLGRFPERSPANHPGECLLPRLTAGRISAILGALLLGECAHAGDPPDFSHYPQVKGFLACVALHTNGLNVLHTNSLLISEFYRMDRLGGDALQYAVSDRGQVLDYYDPGDGSITQPRRRQFSPTELGKLRLAVGELPATNQYPELSSLVIVSHRVGTNWVTHSYARRSNEIGEAPALRQILNVIGERPEAQGNFPF